MCLRHCPCKTESESTQDSTVLDYLKDKQNSDFWSTQEEENLERTEALGFASPPTFVFYFGGVEFKLSHSSNVWTLPQAGYFVGVEGEEGPYHLVLNPSLEEENQGPVRWL